MKNLTKKVLNLVTLEILYKSLQVRKLELARKREKLIDKMTSKTRAASETIEIFEDLASKGGKLYLEASKLRRLEQVLAIKQNLIKLVRRTALWVILLGVLMLVQIYAPGLGGSVRIDYYAVLSQVYPVLLIALYVGGPKSTTQTRALTRINHISLRFLMNIVEKFHGVFGVIIGLIVSLTAVASNYTSTFLFLVTIFSLLSVGLVLIQNLGTD